MQLKAVAVPSLDGKQQDQKIKDILEYTVALKKQIDFVLKNIGTDNMETKVATVIEKAVTSGEMSDVVTDKQFRSYVTRTAKLIQTKVAKDSVISTINQSAEAIAIEASKINLTGYVSINETFTVDEHGYLVVTGGKIGGFSIGATAQYFGTNSADVAPALYWGNADILKATEITDSGARKDWRFKIGASCGITAAGAIYANEGHFRGIVDAGAVSYGAGNTLAGDALTNYTINVYKISSHAIDSSAMEEAYATLKSTVATINGYFSGTLTASNFAANYITSSQISSSKYFIGSSQMTLRTKTINGTSFTYLGTA